MLALLPLALSVLPGIIDLIAGDKAGKVAGLAASAVATITGTTDPVAAKAVLDADPGKAADLRAKLADIALEHRRLEIAEMQSVRNLSAAVPLVAKTQVAGFAAFFLVWSSMIARINIWGLPEGADVATFANTLAAVSAILGLIIQFFYGNSTAAHAANQRLDKMAEGMANGAVPQAPVPPPLEYLPPPSPREPVPQDTPADDLNARELGETPKPRVRVPAPSAAAAGARLDAALDVTLPEEGGFANHPRDKGGPTQMGITYRTLAAWREVNPAAITVEDVRALKREDVRPIYNANYWLANRCDQMAPGVDAAVFDFCVNSGRAVKVIQEVLGVRVDGRVGPVTLAALAALPAAEAINRICDARLAYVRTLDDWDAFGNGWKVRIDRVRVKALAIAAS